MTVRTKKEFSGWLVLLIFEVVMLVLYAPTLGAGFVTDFIGWQMRYEGGDFADILNCFGYPGLHQLLHLFFFSFYKIFDTQGLPWYLLFCSLHAVNAFALYQLFKKVFHRFSLPAPGEVSLSGALIFLVLPYQSEPVVWMVCLHYLMTALLMMGSLWFALNYLESHRSKFIWLAHLCFVAALFMLEIAFVMPLLMVVWVWIVSSGIEQSPGRRPLFFRLIFPQFALLTVYLVLNKLVLGQWVGHYGEQAHLNFPVLQMIGTTFKYLIKYTFFVRYFDHTTKEALFGIFDQAWLVMALAIAGLISLGLAIVYFKKLSTSLKIAGMLLLLFFLSVAPVSNMYFYTLLYIENDRYGYHGSLFLSMLVALSFFTLPKFMRYPLLIGYIGISVFLTQKTNRWWSESREVYYGLLHDFRWYDRDEVIILNIPDSYQGAYSFRIIDQDSGLADYLRYSIGKEYKGRAIDVLQYNMCEPDASIRVEQVDSNTVKVAFNQWGNWWWRNGIGASNYENDRYRVELLDGAYLLHLKNLHPNTAIIYQVGSRWEEYKPAEELR